MLCLNHDLLYLWGEGDFLYLFHLFYNFSAVLMNDFIQINLHLYHLPLLIVIGLL